MMYVYRKISFYSICLVWFQKNEEKNEGEKKNTNFTRSLCLSARRSALDLNLSLSSIVYHSEDLGTHWVLQVSEIRDSDLMIFYFTIGNLEVL